MLQFDGEYQVFYSDGRESIIDLQLDKQFLFSIVHIQGARERIYYEGLIVY